MVEQGHCAGSLQWQAAAKKGLFYSRILGSMERELPSFQNWGQERENVGGFFFPQIAIAGHILAFPREQSIIYIQLWGEGVGFCSVVHELKA